MFSQLLTPDLSPLASHAPESYQNQPSCPCYLWVLAGAAGPSSGSPASLIPVKGKVTYKGQPLATGVVEFEPDGYGRPGRGQLKSDGTFELTTYKDGDGVVAGEHRVSTSQFDKTLKEDCSFKKYTGPVS